MLGNNSDCVSDRDRIKSCGDSERTGLLCSSRSELFFIAVFWGWRWEAALSRSVLQKPVPVSPVCVWGHRQRLHRRLVRLVSLGAAAFTGDAPPQAAAQEDHEEDAELGAAGAGQSSSQLQRRLHPRPGGLQYHPEPGAESQPQHVVPVSSVQTQWRRHQETQRVSDAQNRPKYD